MNKIIEEKLRKEIQKDSLLNLFENTIIDSMRTDWKDKGISSVNDIFQSSKVCKYVEDSCKKYSITIYDTLYFATKIKHFRPMCQDSCPCCNETFGWFNDDYTTVMDYDNYINKGGYVYDVTKKYFKNYHQSCYKMIQRNKKLEKLIK